jgi:SAM-dependent methyltransferase
VPVLSPNDQNRYENLTPGYEGVGEFYDLFADNSDLPFYVEYAQRLGSPILDLAAGTGRVTFALARVGHDVVALEQSPSMLSVAKKHLQNSSREVTDRVSLVEGSMTDFALDRKFRLIIIPTSFAHALTTDDQLSTLRCVYDHLLDDGRFILDLFPSSMQYEHATFEDMPVKLEDGRTVSRKGEIHSDLSKHLMRMDLQYSIRNAEGKIIKQIDIVSGAALIFNREADLLIRLSGFEIEAEFGDFEGNPYTPESGRRIFVLRKGD